MGELLWKLIILNIVGDFILGGIVDLVLYLLYGYQATMTAFLRQHPIWFTAPAALVLVLVGGLLAHLFVFTKW